MVTLLPSILSQLNHKFLIKPKGFEGMHRIEKGEYPVAAMREMILNALVHRNYMGASIQINYIYAVNTEHRLTLCWQQYYTPVMKFDRMLFLILISDLLKREL